MQAGYLIMRINQLGRRVCERVFEENQAGAFSGNQGKVLYVLWKHDGITIGDISRGSGLACPTLSGILEDMEQKGLIRRELDPRDRRKNHIFLTAEARKLESEFNEVTRQITGIFYKDFTGEEAEQLNEYLSRMLRNVEEASQPTLKEP